RSSMKAKRSAWTPAKARTSAAHNPVLRRELAGLSAFVPRPLFLLFFAPVQKQNRSGVRPRTFHDGVNHLVLDGAWMGRPRDTGGRVGDQVVIRGNLKTESGNLAPVLPVIHSGPHRE